MFNVFQFKTGKSRRGKKEDKGAVILVINQLNFAGKVDSLSIVNRSTKHLLLRGHFQNKQLYIGRCNKIQFNRFNQNSIEIPIDIL